MRIIKNQDVEKIKLQLWNTNVCGGKYCLKMGIYPKTKVIWKVTSQFVNMNKIHLKTLLMIHFF